MINAANPTAVANTESNSLALTRCPTTIMERTIAEGCIMTGAETVAGLSRANARPPTPLPTTFHVEDAYCRDCNEDEIYIDGKEEPAVYRTGESRQLVSARIRDLQMAGIVDQIHRGLYELESDPADDTEDDQ